MRRNLKFIFIDGLSVFIALYASFLLRFEFDFPKEFISLFIGCLPWFISSQLVVFYFSGLYARIWRYTSLFDLYAILSAVATSCGVAFIFTFFTIGISIYPRSILLLYFIFNCMLTVSIRLSVRVYFSHYNKTSKFDKKKPKKLLLLIGAGATGEKISREIRTRPEIQYKIAGFIDDDKEKHGALLHGKKVFCNVNDLPNLKIAYDEILITVPSASGNQMRKIVERAKLTGKPYKTVPGINELIDGEVSLDTMRDVSYSDLLGRKEVQLDMNSLNRFLHGKRMLITGAGGSIGSELVRQCLAFDPAEIVCLDNSEEKIYNLDQFSEKIQSKTIIKTVLGSINNRNELNKVFVDNQPQIVFHAAAYKHVPIQELYPWNAVNTNLGGTLNLVELSDKFSVEKFVLVSTDKAVNPANVMGATKRCAEKLIQSYNSISSTTYMAVRFGNVLGSSGSAIPTFQKQINNGGPITITHPEMTRYFMSIQEASQLILQCGSFGKDGEIFLLEMGNPIKILQMAKDLIKLSGLEPEVDIPIVYTGLRPGEKLYEELKLQREDKVNTTHKKIMILQGKNLIHPWEKLQVDLIELLNAAKALDLDKIQFFIKQIIPTYNPSIGSVILEENKYKYSIKGEA